MRKIYDHLFTLSEPHCFHLPPVYKFSKLIWEGLKEKDDALSTAMVSAGQLYEWLKDDGDFEVKCRCLKQDLFDDEHYKALYALWCDSRIPVREIDFLWRTALGGLKTGEFVSMYSIPDTAYAIVLCRRNQHMFAEQGAVLWSLLINIDAKSYVTRSCKTNILQTIVKTK